MVSRTIAAPHFLNKVPQLSYGYISYQTYVSRNRAERALLNHARVLVPAA